jgi:4-amino-4-deoxy-L-arabinose transferase-like glycosyltransferase
MRVILGGARPWLLPAMLAVLAFAVRVGWIAYADFRPTLGDDAGRYDLLGRSLADGGGYINVNGTTTMFWPPGWPFILTAIYKLWPERWFGGHEVTAALVVNAVLGAVTVLLVFAIARRAGFSHTAAATGAAILALFPSLIFLGGTTLSETSFIFTVFLALWFAVEAEAPGRSVRTRALMIAGAGVLIGYAALIRGQGLLLPVIFAPFWWYTHRDLRAAAARVAVTAGLAALVISPWLVRNYVESGGFVPISSNSGPDFYIGHSEGADGRARKVDELVFRHAELKPPKNELQVTRDGFREGVEWALDHPRRELELSWLKVYYLYRDDQSALRWSESHGENAFLSGRTRDALLALSNGYYWIVLALAAGFVLAPVVAWGVIETPAALRRPPPGSAEARLAPAVRVLLVSFVAGFTLVHIVFFGEPRFHAPMAPVFSLWAGGALAAAWELLPRATHVPARNAHKG